MSALVTHSDYKRLIPSRFWSRTAAANHRFRIAKPWWQPFKLVELTSGDLKLIAPSAYCVFTGNGSTTHLLIDEKKYPLAANAVVQMGRLLFTGDRVGKYMALFKAYESLSATLDIRFGALRHALTHAQSALNRPKTVRSLENDFGTTNVDLSIYRHQSVFWTRFGELLVLVDTLIGDELTRIASVVRMPENVRRPLTVAVAQWDYSKAYESPLSNQLLHPSTH
jgi:hypothetical protein